MTIPVILLLSYGAALGWGADRALARSSWAERHPRAAIMVWHGTAVGFLGALICASLLLAHDVVEHVLARLLQADKALLHSVYAPAQEIPRYWNGSLGLLVAGSALLIAAWFQRTRNHRAVSSLHQSAVSETIHLVEADDDVIQVGIVESSLPLIYCLARTNPGPRILATRGAIDLLPPPLLEAAIAHESSHLRHRHHLSVLLADVVTSTFRRSGLLSNYHSQMAHLIELQADDDAADRHGRREVARALLAVSTAGPAGTVPGNSWTGGSPAVRIRRLMAEDVPTSPRASGLVACACSGLIAVVPVAATLLPATPHVGTAGDAAIVSHHNVPASGFVHHR